MEENCTANCFFSIILSEISLEMLRNLSVMGTAEIFLGISKISSGNSLKFLELKDFRINQQRKNGIYEIEKIIFLIINNKQ